MGFQLVMCLMYRSFSNLLIVTIPYVGNYHHRLTDTFIYINVTTKPCRWPLFFFFTLLDRYEKMISGMYLGEISRQAILKLAKEKLLFNGVVSAELQKPWAFESKFLTDIEK